MSFPKFGYFQRPNLDVFYLMRSLRLGFLPIAVVLKPGNEPLHAAKVPANRSEDKLRVGMVPENPSPDAGAGSQSDTVQVTMTVAPAGSSVPELAALAQEAIICTPPYLIVPVPVRYAFWLPTFVTAKVQLLFDMLQLDALASAIAGRVNCPMRPNKNPVSATAAINVTAISIIVAMIGEEALLDMLGSRSKVHLWS